MSGCVLPLRSLPIQITTIRPLLGCQMASPHEIASLHRRYKSPAPSTGWKETFHRKKLLQLQVLVKSSCVFKSRNLETLGVGADVNHRNLSSKGTIWYFMVCMGPLCEIRLILSNFAVRMLLPEQEQWYGGVIRGGYQLKTPHCETFWGVASSQTARHELTQDVDTWSTELNDKCTERVLTERTTPMFSLMKDMMLVLMSVSLIIPYRADQLLDTVIADRSSIESCRCSPGFNAVVSSLTFCNNFWNQGSYTSVIARFLAQRPKWSSHARTTS